MTTFEQLDVWKISRSLVKEIYSLTERFPASERYCFTDQMRRAALSIPSNIAEGSKRSTRNEYRRFCLMALGSASELHTQTQLAKELGLAPAESFAPTEQYLERVMKMLHKLTSALLSHSKTEHRQPKTE